MIGPRAERAPHEKLMDCQACGGLVRVCGWVDDLEDPFRCIGCRIKACGVVWDEAKGKK